MGQNLHGFADVPPLGALQPSLFLWVPASDELDGDAATDDRGGALQAPQGDVAFRIEQAVHLRAARFQEE